MREDVFSSKDIPRGEATAQRPQELLDSGLVISKLMEAELPRSDGHIEVLVDDMA